MSLPKPSHSVPPPPRLQKSLKINSSLDDSVSIRHSFSSSLPSSNGSERKPTAPRAEKRAPIVSKAAGLHQVQEDLARTRELLCLMEKSKSNLMQDLARAKRNVEDLTMKLLEKSKSRGETIQSNKTDDNAIMSHGNGNHQIEIDSMRDRYENALLEIEANKQAMEALKHELLVCIEAKDEAVRLAGEAMTAAESTSRRVSELSFELSRRNTRQILPTNNSSEIRLNEFTDELSVSFDESLLGCEELYGTSNHDDAFMVSECGQIMGIKNVFLEETPETQISTELEETQEKLLNLTLTEGVLISSLDFLKEKLESSQEKMKSRETTASCEVEDMKSRLERMTIRNQEDMLLLKQKEASALSDMEDLKVELSNHKSEIALMVEKEQAIIANADALRKELDAKNQELIEHRKEWNDVIVALRVEVERIEAELVKQKERECVDSARIASLVCDLERQKADGVDLQERLSEMNGKYESILALSHNDEVTLIELKEREMNSNGKIAALNTEVFELSKCLEESQRNGQVSQMEMVREKEMASLRFAALEGRLEEKQSEIEDLRKRLSEMDAKYTDISLSCPAFATNNDVKGLELKERETNENAEIVVVNADFYELKTALGNALRVGRITQEDWQNAQILLERTVFEREKWRKEADIAEKVAQAHKQIASDALAGAQISKDDARRALEAANVVEEKSLTSVKRAMAEFQLAKKEAEELKVVLQETMKSLEVARIEAEKAKDEARIARDELALIKIDSTMKDKGDDRDTSLKMSRDELLTRNELESRKGSTGAWEEQSREEVEEEESRDTNEERKCLYDNNTGDIILSEEGMDSLKMKLEACERELEVAIAEAGTLGLENEKLRMDLSVADSEREANKKAVVEAHRSLVEMEKAKSVLEGDIQRLLDESKRMKALPETKDIPIHSNLNQNPVLECREEKPQPDPPQGEGEEEVNVINVGMMTPLHMNKKGEMVDLDGLDPPQNTTMSGKKKKNPLLYRLHSYLDKKKNSHV